MVEVVGDVQITVTEASNNGFDFKPSEERISKVEKELGEVLVLAQKARVSAQYQGKLYGCRSNCCTFQRNYYWWLILLGILASVASFAAGLSFLFLSEITEILKSFSSQDSFNVTELTGNATSESIILIDGEDVTSVNFILKTIIVITSAILSIIQPEFEGKGFDSLHKYELAEQLVAKAPFRKIIRILQSLLTMLRLGHLGQSIDGEVVALLIDKLKEVKTVSDDPTDEKVKSSCCKKPEDTFSAISIGYLMGVEESFRQFSDDAIRVTKKATKAICDVFSEGVKLGEELNKKPIDSDILSILSKKNEEYTVLDRAILLLSGGYFSLNKDLNLIKGIDTRRIRQFKKKRKEDKCGKVAAYIIGFSTIAILVYETVADILGSVNVIVRFCIMPFYSGLFIYTISKSSIAMIRANEIRKEMDIIRIGGLGSRIEQAPSSFAFLSIMSSFIKESDILLKIEDFLKAYAFTICKSFNNEGFGELDFEEIADAMALSNISDVLCMCREPERSFVKTIQGQRPHMSEKQIIDEIQRFKERSVVQTIKTHREELLIEGDIESAPSSVTSRKKTRSSLTEATLEMVQYKNVLIRSQSSDDASSGSVSSPGTSSVHKISRKMLDVVAQVQLARVTDVNTKSGINHQVSDPLSYFKEQKKKSKKREKVAAKAKKRGAHAKRNWQLSTTKTGLRAYDNTAMTNLYHKEVQSRQLVQLSRLRSSTLESIQGSDFDEEEKKVPHTSLREGGDTKIDIEGGQ